MKTEDVEYLCSTIGNLAGIPVRIYSREKMIFYYSLIIRSIIKSFWVPRGNGRRTKRT